MTEEQLAALPEASGTPPWQEPDAGVCCENGHITQLAFALNNLAGEIVSNFFIATIMNAIMIDVPVAACCIINMTNAFSAFFHVCD
jgi:hypothetical protein